MPRFYDPAQPSSGYVSPIRNKNGASREQQDIYYDYLEGGGGAAGASQHQSVHDNLYQRGIIAMATREVTSQEVTAARAAQKEEDELKACTFRPVTHSHAAIERNKINSDGTKKSIFQRLGVDAVKQKRLKDEKNKEKKEELLERERRPESRQAKELVTKSRVAAKPDGISIFDNLYKQGVKSMEKRKTRDGTPTQSPRGHPHNAVKKMCPFKPNADATKKEQERREALSQAAREREMLAYEQRKEEEERAAAELRKKEEKRKQFLAKYDAMKPKHSLEEQTKSHKERLRTPSSEPFSSGCPPSRNGSRSRSRTDKLRSKSGGAGAEQRSTAVKEANTGTADQDQQQQPKRRSVSGASARLLQPTVSSRSRNTSPSPRGAMKDKDVTPVRVGSKKGSTIALPRGRPAARSGSSSGSATATARPSSSASPDPSSPPRPATDDQPLTLDEL